MTEGTSPSSSYDEGSRSIPSNLPATRARKKKTSDSEDEDHVAVDDEATSKKIVLKKEYGTAAAIKPGLNKKAPARRIPMSKARASTQETMEFTLEPKEGGEERVWHCCIDKARHEHKGTSQKSSYVKGQSIHSRKFGI